MKLRALAVVALGLAAVAISFAFTQLPEVLKAGACMTSGTVLEFELARDGEDLARILSAGGDACGPLLLSAFDAVNRLDMLAFIPAYSLFSAAAAVFLANGAWRPLSIVAVAAALGAAAADYVETIALLDVTQTAAQPDALLARSHAAALAKFALLAVHAMACAGMCFLSATKRPLVGALWLVPTIAVAIAAYDGERFVAAISPAFGVAWLGLLFAAVKEMLSKAPGGSR